MEIKYFQVALDKDEQCHRQKGMKAFRKEFTFDDYDTVFTGDVDLTSAKDIFSYFEEQWKLNDKFLGHTPGVSDILEIKRKDSASAFYFRDKKRTRRIRRFYPNLTLSYGLFRHHIRLLYVQPGKEAEWKIVDHNVFCKLLTTKGFTVIYPFEWSPIAILYGCNLDSETEKNRAVVVNGKVTQIYGSFLVCKVGNSFESIPAELEPEVDIFFDPSIKAIGDINNISAIVSFAEKA